MHDGGGDGSLSEERSDFRLLYTLLHLLMYALVHLLVWCHDSLRIVFKLQVKYKDVID
jgi:hypothetical protein